MDLIGIVGVADQMVRPAQNSVGPGKPPVFTTRSQPNQLHLPARLSGGKGPKRVRGLCDGNRADAEFLLFKHQSRALAGASAEPEGLRCHGVWAAPRWARGLPLLGERAGLVFYGAA